MQRTSESGAFEVFDPRGDLRLIVGPDQISFRVCSRSLARSSSYWETLLYGPFAEGQGQQKAGSDWVIPLPEDRPEGLRILCFAVHGKFDALPSEMTHAELLYVVVLADKYNMVGSLKPFWKDWVQDPDCVTDNTPTADELLDYLAVCHKLGYGRGFREAFAYFVKCAAAHDDGRLYIDGFPDHDIYDDDYVWLQDKVFDDVKRGREMVLKMICNKIQYAIVSLILQSKCNVYTSPTCDCTMLGALVRAMVGRGLDHWFHNQMAGVADSITDYVSKFSSLLAELRGEMTVALESLGRQHAQRRTHQQDPENGGASDRGDLPHSGNERSGSRSSHCQRTRSVLETGHQTMD
ncbi:hypothetical protein F5144DRAFT_391990, partial [Chaetomium tenue]